ncbi:DMT family transporter [Clostridium septicum]|uniref:DMT family transporter n=1 Tax=Clostridium septicum TaxID=1504 RepID=A0A9N7PJ27_CLOSE|nr:DMT family transporter [Clostridium septicum]AYE34290.1 EamA-like transporter family protein [Clostridium septicum]MDU1313315.1 DMT family transporter [Clostridium septicum]QAS59684.1 DMT family transporter [Clostridium septicum]UEC21072.1 DMT family transporter [Clostridium septicum]USS00879.1 DMT family transporter [Clostridium septicum]
MFAIICAIISGISMSLQGVFNTRLEEKIGTWETNAFVQATGLALTLIILFFFGKGNFKEIKDANKLYLLGGVLGVIIIFTVMKSIGAMGATCGIAIILVAQLTSAGIIDAFGLFGTDKIPFSMKEFIGIAIMIIGIVIFKWKL